MLHSLFWLCGRLFMEESKAKPAVGRPSSYDPKYCREIVSYFDRPPVIDGEAVDLPTLSGFARKIKKHRETLLNWAEHSPEFFDAIKLCKDMQEDILVQNALKGRYEQAFSIIFAKNNLG